MGNDQDAEHAGTSHSPEVPSSMNFVGFPPPLGAPVASRLQCGQQNGMPRTNVPG